MSIRTHNKQEDDIIHTIKENGRMILYAVDYKNMFGYRAIDMKPLRFNPLTVDNCEISKVVLKRYDARYVGMGPCYQVWFTMSNDPKPISGVGRYAVWDSDSFETYSSCVLIPEKDITMVLREVKIMSVVGCGEVLVQDGGN